MKTKFRRSFLGAEQVCILIGSWIMTQNANISVSGIYRFCKKCCNQIFSIHHGWIVPLYYVNKTISTNNWVNFWISIIKQLWDLALENFVTIQGSKWHFGSIFLNVSCSNPRHGHLSVNQLSLGTIQSLLKFWSTKMNCIHYL